MKKKMPSNKSFGITFFLFFLVISLYPLINNHKINVVFLVMGILFLILGLLKSNLLNPLNKAWMKFGFVLSKIINPIILFLIYYLIVVPTGLLLKILKKDILELNINKQKKSYWINKKNFSDMRNQF